MSVPRVSRVLLASCGLVGLVATGVMAAPSGAALAAARLHRAPPAIAAKEAELFDATGARELWGLQQNTQRPIASITKVMTAIVVIDAGDLGRRIRITWADAHYVCCGIAGAGLIPGDVLTARQLLYAMLLPSGADAAMALADTFGPGQAAFVHKMNQTAAALHMTGTHFTSFDGVLASNVSTPSDLMRLGQAAMSLPDLRAVVGSVTYQLSACCGHHHYFWRNRNQLLVTYSGAAGIKTGWIPASGECLLFAAVRGGRELIGVVLDSASTNTSSQSFVDATGLLNWGFAQP